MGFFASIAGAISSFLALLRGRQEAQHDDAQQAVGRQTQTVADQSAAIKAEQNMGAALASAPTTQKELDQKLSQGKF